MKILITGAAGFLGSYLVEHFLKEGHYVHGIDNMLGGNLENLMPFAIEQGDYSLMKLHPNFQFNYIDCRNIGFFFGSAKDKTVPGIMEKTQFDVVYHCAATAHEGLSVFSPSFITSNIYEATVAMVSASIASNVKRFIFMSSMARYGNGYNLYEKKTNPKFTEQTYPLVPVDPYGIAKKAAEDTLACLAKTHGMEYIIAVPHNIIGVRQNYTDPARNVVSIMMNKVKLGEMVNVYGDGEQTRCFSPIEDCISCLVKLATINYHDFKRATPNQVINIGPDSNPLTINQLRFKIERLKGGMAWRHLPPRPLEVTFATCSSDLARKLLGYTEIKNIDETLKEMWDAIPPEGKPFVEQYPIEIITEKTPEPFIPSYQKRTKVDSLATGV